MSSGRAARASGSSPEAASSCSAALSVVDWCWATTSCCISKGRLLKTSGSIPGGQTRPNSFGALPPPPISAADSAGAASAAAAAAVPSVLDAAAASPSPSPSPLLLPPPLPPSSSISLPNMASAGDSEGEGTTMPFVRSRAEGMESVGGGAEVVHAPSASRSPPAGTARGGRPLPLPAVHVAPSGVSAFASALLSVMAGCAV
mmetsp:Transcript_7909/g.22002  ORF Transcript_7909/g.22002 Transcript_7909/m.22002 type:complete len:202 (-) Transcript_7909:19-624(-)